MRLIDTHCHLAGSRLRQQAPQVLLRARQAGVEAVVCAAASVQESAAALALAGEHPEVYCTAGVHPHEAKNAGVGYLQALAKLAEGPRNVAIGEIGLDYHYNYSPPPDQRQAFAEQLELARRLGKPVVIHTRQAFEDTMAILAASGLDGGRVLFHSFTEGPAAVRRVLDLGATVSFSGIVTFSSAAEVQQAAGLTPQDRLLVETDAPYLSPEPVRKMKTNEPANVAYVAAFLARLRHADPEGLAEATTANARRFFGLDTARSDE